jgi:hypothetical protein
MADDGQHFDVFFAGECLEGQDPQAVRAALARLFKADDATLERLFSGTRQVIKRACDEATAVTYQRAMRRAGAKPVIVRRRAAEAVPRAATAPSPSPSPDPAPDSAAGDLQLAPPGSGVLRPDERREHAPRDIPTDHLHAEQLGAALAPVADAAPARVAPDYELAAAGAQLAAAGADTGPAETGHPPAAPDTSALQLVAGEFDLSDCAPPPAPPPDLDLGHMQAAAVGEDLLTEEQRRRTTPAAPDTDHLQLQPDPATD